MGHEDLPRGRGELSATLGWEDPPPEFDLLQVLYVVRHGERAPVRMRMESANPPIPRHWNLCHTSHQFRRAVLRYANESSTDYVASRALIQRRVEFAFPGEAPRIGALGDCLLGELTDRGRASLLHIGMALRARYIEGEHLLPRHMTERDKGAVYFRSTDMRRTIQSLEELVTGLLEPYTDRDSTLVPEIYVRNALEEDLVPLPNACHRLKTLFNKFAAQAIRLYNPLLEQFDADIAPHNNGSPARLDSHPRLSGLIDTVRSADAHGIPTPAIFHDEFAKDLMERAVLHEWFGGYASPSETERLQFQRLALGGFVGTLYGAFARRVLYGPNEPLRLGVFLGHDATIVGLLHILEVFNYKWPAFAASVSFELFHDTKAKGTCDAQHMLGHYVRCRYGDETLRLPGCATQGAHYPGYPELCTLDAFRAIVVDRLRHPEGMPAQEECAS